MNDNEIHFVAFDKYCEKCENWKLNEVKDPCNDCLEISTRPDTEKPQYYKERT